MAEYIRTSQTRGNSSMGDREQLTSGSKEQRDAKVWSQKMMNVPISEMLDIKKKDFSGLKAMFKDDGGQMASSVPDGRRDSEMKMNEIMQSEKGQMGIGFFKKDILEDRRGTNLNSPDFDSTQVSFNNTRL